MRYSAAALRSRTRTCVQYTITGTSTSTSTTPSTVPVDLLGRSDALFARVEQRRVHREEVRARERQTQEVVEVAVRQLHLLQHVAPQLEPRRALLEASARRARRRARAARFQVLQLVREQRVRQPEAEPERHSPYTKVQSSGSICTSTLLSSVTVFEAIIYEYNHLRSRIQMNIVVQM